MSDPIPLEIVSTPNRQLIADLNGVVAQAIRLHIDGSVSIARGLAFSALCGKTLSELRKQLGHGNWLPFVKEHLEPAGLAERTCRYHMQVWEAAKRKAFKSDDYCGFETLLEMPIAEMADADRATLLNVTSKICKHHDAKQLLLEFGLSREKSAGPNPKPALEPTPEEAHERALEAIREKFKGTFQALHYATTDAAHRVMNDAEIEGAIEHAEAFTTAAYAWLKLSRADRIAQATAAFR